MKGAEAVKWWEYIFWASPFCMKQYFNNETCQKNHVCASAFQEKELLAS